MYHTINKDQPLHQAQPQPPQPQPHLFQVSFEYHFHHTAPACQSHQLVTIPQVQAKVFAYIIRLAPQYQ